MITTSIITAKIIYVAYNAISMAIFGVPHSLSMTYYLWKEKSNIGYVFPVMMAVVVALMMPAWITMSEGSDFQFLAFLAPASLLFVGAAPAFMDSDLENKVHSISAVIAAICSLTWVCVVTPYWCTIIVFLGLIAAIAILTKSVKSALTYWLETIAFGATFTSAILYSM